MGDYHAPAGGLDVAIPRTPARIVLQTFILHLCADYAFTYLAELLPRFRHNSFNQRCLQVLILWHMPEVLLMQLTTTLLAVAVEESGVAGPQGLVNFSNWAGFRRFKSRIYRDEIGKLPWQRLPVLAAALLGLWAGSTTYTERFTISYHQMTDVGMLGIDHRNGWTSFIGLLAAVMALVVRGYLWLQPKIEVNLDHDSGRAQLELEKDEEMAHYDACEVPILNMSLEHAVLLVEAFVATAIHQIPLAATHRSLSIVNFLPATLILVIVFVGLAAKTSRPRIAEKASLALKWILILIIAWTIVEPSIDDLDELYDASATITHAWTYRWQVTDRFDRILRVFI